MGAAGRYVRGGYDGVIKCEGRGVRGMRAANGAEG